MSLMLHGLSDAYAVATLSPDPSTQCGACLQCVGAQPVCASNSYPAQEAPGPAERLLDRAYKSQWIEHAERRVIYRAAAQGFSTSRATLYAPWAACVDCARAIIAASVARVVVHKQRMDVVSERWAASIAAAHEMLRFYGIEIIEYDGPIAVTPIRIQGRLWCPRTLQFLTVPQHETENCSEDTEKRS